MEKKYDENSGIGLALKNINERLRSLQEMERLTEKLEAESNSGSMEQLAFLVDERQGLINLMKRNDKEAARVAKEAKINYTECPQLERPLAHLREAEKRIRKMEEKVWDKMLGRLGGLKEGIKQTRTGKKFVRAYGAGAGVSAAKNLDRKA